MFDSFYPFNYQTKIKQSHPVLAKHIFTFDVNEDRFIVHVDEFSNSFYGIKFFPKSQRLNPRKYNIILNKYSVTEFSKILRTCIEIMFKFLDTQEKSSFGFIGSHTIGADFEEPIENTQRFYIYSDLMSIFLETRNLNTWILVKKCLYTFNRLNDDQILKNILKDISENYKIIFED